MKFLEELGEAESNLSYAYANLKKNSSSTVAHNEMKQFKRQFTSFFNHVKSYSTYHGNKWLFKTVQSSDIMSEEEKDVEDILIMDDDFDFDLYKSQLSESIKQNQVIKGNLTQTFLTMAEDPHMRMSDEESETIATNAINQASWASLQAEQSLQLYTRIANQNNFIVDKERRVDIPDQLMDIRRKSMSLVGIPVHQNGNSDMNQSMFSVNESMISMDTQQAVQQQT